MYYCEIQRQLKQIEEMLKQISNKPSEYQINIHMDVHIDTLDAHNPVLENLTFQLDKLDIKELGGALNLENNFGVEIKKNQGEQQKQQKDEKQEQSSKRKQDSHVDKNEGCTFEVINNHCNGYYPMDPA